MLREAKLKIIPHTKDTSVNETKEPSNSKLSK